MGKMQRDKGKRGEREVVKIMHRLGFPEARRARQSDGAIDPDVAGCDPFWIEVKRRSSIAACRFMDQAVQDVGANPHRIPIVWMREDGGDWLVVVKSDDLERVVGQLHDAGKSCEQSRHTSADHAEETG